MICTQEILETVGCRYQAGETTAAIAATYGVNKATIVRWLHRTNITPLTGPQRMKGKILKDGQRHCTLCKRGLPDEAFTKNSLLPRGRSYICRDCAKEDGRRRKIKHDYGITLEQYDAMLRAQQGVCAICGTGDPGLSYRWGSRTAFCVDHDHTTGQIRGLLCQGCNKGIANFQDDPALLHQAIAYLHTHGK